VWYKKVAMELLLGTTVVNSMVIYNLNKFQQNYPCLNLPKLYEEVLYVQIHKNVLKSHKPFQNVLLNSWTEKMKNCKEKDVMDVI